MTPQEQKELADKVDPLAPIEQRNGGHDKRARPKDAGSGMGHGMRTNQVPACWRMTQMRKTLIAAAAIVTMTAPAMGHGYYRYYEQWAVLSMTTTPS